MKKMLYIGAYLEELLNLGTIAENQVCVYIDKNNNIKWIGKAAYAPIYLDWITFDHAETVGNELRIYEPRAEQPTPAPEAPAEATPAEETTELFDSFWDVYPALNLTAEEIIKSMNIDGVIFTSGEPVTMAYYNNAVQRISGTHSTIKNNIITADRQHAARLTIYPSGMIDLEEILIAR